MLARSLPVALALFSIAPEAAAQCAEDGKLMVGLSAASGLGAGAATGLASSGIIVSADPDTSFKFTTGLLAASAVTGGLSALYGFIDAFTGCTIVNEQGGFAWSIPVTMAVVGSLLPIAIWGASGDDSGASFIENIGDGTGEPQGIMPMTPGMTQPAPQLRATFRF